MRVASALISVDRNWKWDDFNYTDFPRGVATLVSGQKDYTLPTSATGTNASTLLKVNRICVLDTASNEIELIRADLPEGQLNNTYTTSGRPVFYKLISNSVRMWPAPDAGVSVTLTSGLVVYFERTFDEFTVADTTQQPGFAATHHNLLQFFASAQYLLPINQDRAAGYLQLFNQGLEALKDEYVNSNDDVANRITVRRYSSR